jgi:hypothetical protein
VLTSPRPSASSSENVLQERKNVGKYIDVTSCRSPRHLPSVPTLHMAIWRTADERVDELCSSSTCGGRHGLRTAIDDAAPSEHTKTLSHGVTQRPLMAYFDSVDFWLADGFHPYHAYRAAGVDEVASEARAGSRRDALLCWMKPSRLAGATTLWREPPAYHRRMSIWQSQANRVVDALKASFSETLANESMGSGQPLLRLDLVVPDFAPWRMA